MRIANVFLLATMAFAADPAAVDYPRALTDWRAQREAKLKADDGWLTVVGLSWLKPGDSRVGSDPASEVRLPASAPAYVGKLTVKAGKVLYTPANGTARMLKPDTEPNYDKITVGRVKFFIIQREEKLGVRIKDNNSSTRREFSGLKWYPADPSWRVEAQYVPWDKPHTLTFDTEVGVKEQDMSPGYVTFSRAGKEYRLEPVAEGDTLWFVMRDETSGKSTYAASRFLYAPLPKGGLKKAGPVEIDFNRAENPPCVFTAFATCPLPPPQNRIALAVTAGEQMYGKGH